MANLSNKYLELLLRAWGNEVIINEHVQHCHAPMQAPAACTIVSVAEKFARVDIGDHLLYGDWHFEPPNGWIV
jgi:hypothetical protein